MKGIAGFIETRSLNEFGDWLHDTAVSYSNAYEMFREQNSANQLYKGKTHQISGSTNFEQPWKPVCLKCNLSHQITNCPEFCQSNVKERLEIAKQLRLCFTCLKGKHNSVDCRNKRKCGIDNCQRYHHRMIHEEPQKSHTNNNTVDAPQETHTEKRQKQP